MRTTPMRSLARSLGEITFIRDMLGWVGATRFVLDPLADDPAEESVFAALRCTDPVRLRNGAAVPGPVFLVAPPGHFAPHYQISLDERFAENLDLVVPDDAALLAIITRRQPLERSTVNLFSPIVVNRHSGLADQFVPTENESEVGWSVRTPLPAALVAEC
jgi:FliW protein